MELPLEGKSGTSQGQEAGNQNGTQIKARGKENTRHQFCAYPKMAWLRVRLEDEPGKTPGTIAQEVGCEGLPFQLSTLGQCQTRLKISPLEIYFLGSVFSLQVVISRGQAIPRGITWKHSSWPKRERWGKRPQSSAEQGLD